ncbi:MAG: winged helix-turn-helix domain-containing protein [Leptospiraceae bacterium]|nr:winged helix-turn-helix domain-containing protein [Leptospiraceae bacterium]
MIYNEELEFEKLVPKVKRIVKIKKDGEPVIVCDTRKLSQNEQIVCYLIGKFFAKQLGLSKSDSASNREISETLGIKEKVVAARLKDLRDDGIVEQIVRGEHKISTVKLEEFLDRVLEKIEKR